MISDILEHVSQGHDLSRDQAYQSMNEIMSGEWTPSQIAGLLMGLKMKGETVDEITGFVSAMRHKAVPISAPARVVDTCGTGGDGTHSFNISTAAALVVAAAGIPVAKHGNRSVSSTCGSADVLQELGVKIDLDAEAARKCLERVGIVFLFAPLYHASMKFAVTPRREMGIKTVFNILGPMLNPANVKRQIIGAFNRDIAEKIAHVLKNSGSEHVLVFCSEDGMDEISISHTTHMIELKDGTIRRFDIEPEDFGFRRVPFEAIRGGDCRQNARIIRETLQGKPGPAYYVTALNAGAAIYAAGQAATLKEGVRQAEAILTSGKGFQKLQEFVEASNSF
ncbi:MAG: anthranilate phosphoribosyltransferase [Calditrichaeota bacterium]|nr:anthranilate phosphoribosyltransferase [Calditrichota bacterium]